MVRNPPMARNKVTDPYLRLTTYRPIPNLLKEKPYRWFATHLWLAISLPIPYLGKQILNKWSLTSNVTPTSMRLKNELRNGTTISRHILLSPSGKQIRSFNCKQLGHSKISAQLMKNSGAFAPANGRRSTTRSPRSTPGPQASQ